MLGILSIACILSGYVTMIWSYEPQSQLIFSNKGVHQQFTTTDTIGSMHIIKIMIKIITICSTNEEWYSFQSGKNKSLIGFSEFPSSNKFLFIKMQEAEPSKSLSHGKVTE